MTTCSGCQFVSKLNPAGSQLAYSTYLPSPEIDGIAVDSQGYAYVVGNVYGAYIPGQFPTTPGAFQTIGKGIDAAFVAKLNLDGTALVYSTFLGGSEMAGVGDFGIYSVYGSIAVDSEGRAYVTGFTFDPDFPVTPDAYQKVNNAVAIGGTNAFFTVFNAAGSGLVYSTYLGGAGLPYSINDGNLAGEVGWAVALGPSGSAYITGSTASTTFPVTAGAYETSRDASFVVRFNFDGKPTTTSLVSDGNPEPAGSKDTLPHT